MADTKYIFVTGGVVSSLGKGIISSSIGKLLQARGYKITIQKFDPYINIDPGTLNPYEHGECYVTADGMETDLDLGHYERFTGIQTTRANSMTTGRIYKSVIDKERRGDYLGKTIQVVPHITDEIKRCIKYLGTKGQYDFVITEIGGTIGDIESAPFLEAIRQLRWEMGRNAINIHLTYVPYLKAAGELKTKPTQHSVKELQSVGIQPDILVLRTEKHLSDGVRMKVASFCNVDLECVVQSEDLPSIYEVPVSMQQQGLDAAILRKLGIPVGETPALGPWKSYLERRRNAKEEVHIGLVGKYDLQDAYKSIRESLLHAGVYNDRKTVITYINSELITKENVAEKLAGQDGLLILYDHVTVAVSVLIIIAGFKGLALIVGPPVRIIIIIMGPSIHMTDRTIGQERDKVDGFTLRLTEKSNVKRAVSNSVLHFVLTAFHYLEYHFRVVILEMIQKLWEPGC